MDELDTELEAELDRQIEENGDGEGLETGQDSVKDSDTEMNTDKASSKAKRGTTTIADDGFFNLDDMNRFADEGEQIGFGEEHVLWFLNCSVYTLGHHLLCAFQLYRR